MTTTVAGPFGLRTRTPRLLTHLTGDAYEHFRRRPSHTTLVAGVLVRSRPSKQGMN